MALIRELEWNRRDGARNGQVATMPRPGVARRGIRPLVFQGTPTGKITGVSVPGYPTNVIPPGTSVRVAVSYEAECVGQPFYAPAWTVSIRAKGNGINVINDTTYLTGGPNIDTVNTPDFTMPNKSVSLEVSLWGNPEAWQKLPPETP